MSDSEIIKRASNLEIGVSFEGKMSRDQVMARLIAAQAKVLAAATELMSDKFKFDGDEIHGRRKSACFLNEEDLGA